MPQCLSLTDTTGPASKSEKRMGTNRDIVFTYMHDSAYFFTTPSTFLSLFLSCTDAISQGNRELYNLTAQLSDSFKAHRPSNNSEPEGISVFYLCGGSPVTGKPKPLLTSPWLRKSTSDASLRTGPGRFPWLVAERTYI